MSSKSFHIVEVCGTDVWPYVAIPAVRHARSIDVIELVTEQEAADRDFAARRRAFVASCDGVTPMEV